MALPKENITTLNTKYNNILSRVKNVQNVMRLSCQKHAILCTLEHSTEIVTLKRYLQTRYNITLAWLRK